MSESGNEAQRSWILSFADLLSLLLCFMVMIFAMSNTQRDQRQPVETGALKMAVEANGRPEPEVIPAGATSRRRRAGPSLDLDYLTALLSATFATDRLLQQTFIERADDRLVVGLPSDLLFAPGETMIADEARPSLDVLARALGNVGNPLGILGHADGEPLPLGDNHTSNWELALARALTLAEALTRAGLARPIACYGLAGTHPDGIRESPEIRREWVRRRVDLVIYASVGDEQ
jgi:chemotaxis protein MotB